MNQPLDKSGDSMIELDHNERKDTTMTHNHFWDTPAVAQPNLVAECACGDQLERIYE